MQQKILETEMDNFLNMRLKNWFYLIFVFDGNLYFLQLSYHFREPLPGDWDANLDSFQKILVLRCLRADKVTNAMQVWMKIN